MNRILAYLCLLLGIACYGLLAIWIVRLSRVGGLTQVPQMIRSLGWEGYAFAAGLVVLGSVFLLASATLAGRGP